MLLFNLGVCCGHKISNYVTVKKTDKINVLMLFLSCIYVPDTHTLSVN